MRRLFLIAVFSLMAVGSFGCKTTGPRYQEVGSFSEGLAPVKSGSGKWGFVNEKQVWIIQPAFDEARPFKEGKAEAKKNGKWGYINRRGEWL